MNVLLNSFNASPSVIYRTKCQGIQFLLKTSAQFIFSLMIILIGSVSTTQAFAQEYVVDQDCVREKRQERQCNTSSGSRNPGNYDGVCETDIEQECTIEQTTSYGQQTTYAFYPEYVPVDISSPNPDSQSDLSSDLAGAIGEITSDKTDAEKEADCKKDSIAKNLRCVEKANSDYNYEVGNCNRYGVGGGVIGGIGFVGAGIVTSGWAWLWGGIGAIATGGGIWGAGTCPTSKEIIRDNAVAHCEADKATRDIDCSSPK